MCDNCGFCNLLGCCKWEVEDEDESNFPYMIEFETDLDEPDIF